MKPEEVELRLRAATGYAASTKDFTEAMKQFGAVLEASALSVYSSSAMSGVDEMFPETSDPIRVKAEDAMQAILDDIAAETLIGEEAVLVRAGEWLTRITTEITKIINKTNVGEEGEDAG